MQNTKMNKNSVAKLYIKRSYSLYMGGGILNSKVGINDNVDINYKSNFKICCYSSGITFVVWLIVFFFYKETE